MVKGYGYINNWIMEHLFSTNLFLNNQPVAYEVSFNQEQYIFLSGAREKEYASFSLRREHDEWHEQGRLPADLKNQAVDVLEKYLLKQH